MARLSRRVSALVLLASFGTYACGDIPTTTANLAATPDRMRPHGSPLRDERSPYVCFGSALTWNGPAKYRYTVQRLHFAAAPNGSLALYRVRFQSPSGEVLGAYTCRIPATREAIRSLEKRFDAENRRGPLKDGWSTDPCSSQGGVCALEPLVVVYHTGYGSSGGGSMGGTPGLGMCEYSASNGDCWYDSYGDWYDGGPDGTYRPDCQRDAAGNCITYEPGMLQVVRLRAQIDSILETHEWCIGAKQALQGAASESRFRFWDGADIRTEGDSSVQRFGQNVPDGQPGPDGTQGTGRLIELDSFWVFEEPWYVVHEGLHYWYNLRALAGNPVDPYPSESEIDFLAKQCVTRFSQLH